MQAAPPFCAAGAVASNAPRVNVLKNLRTTGYDDLLTPNLCFSGLDVPNPKPAPDLHQHILAHFEQSPETALVIEDSPAGAKGACAAGVWREGAALADAGAARWIAVAGRGRRGA